MQLVSAQQTYREHERVPVQVNTVGPFHNPAETYKYYSLPFCKPKEELIEGDDSNLNEVLAGDRRRTSMVRLMKTCKSTFRLVDNLLDVHAQL